MFANNDRLFPTNALRNPSVGVTQLGTTSAMIYIVIGCNGPHRWGLTFNAFQPVMSNTERRSVGVTQLGMVPRTFLFQSHDQPDLPEDRLWRSAFGLYIGYGPMLPLNQRIARLALY
jgi:hypothetical protein